MSQQRNHKGNNKMFKLNGNRKKYIKLKTSTFQKTPPRNKKARDLRENMHNTKDIHPKYKKNP